MSLEEKVVAVSAAIREANNSGKKQTHVSVDVATKDVVNLLLMTGFSVDAMTSPRDVFIYWARGK